MKYAWITQHCDLFPVAVLCEALAVSKSGYYDSVGRKPSSRTERRERIKAAVRTVPCGLARHLRQREDR